MEQASSTPKISNLACKVSIPNTHRDFFDYLILDDVPKIGARVWVPFRKKARLMGIVVGLGAPENEKIALKPICEIIDTTPLLSKEILALCQWVSTYYHSPLSEVIPLVLPKFYRRGDARFIEEPDHYQLVVSALDAHHALTSNAPRQHALIDWFAQTITPKTKKMAIQAGFSSAQFSSLLALNLLQAVKVTPSLSTLNEHLTLNTEQADAVALILQHLQAYQCFLLHGVTGSGKTEVYLQVIAKILAEKQQVLVLVPEIGLTPQLLSRFSERFHAPMAVFHSHLSDSERKVAWQKAADGEVQLVIGTRSAVFVPMPRLKLIIVDEEHDASFKQMDGVRYFARDTALMRAYMENIPIILGSATPSLESIHNCKRDKYKLLRLTHKAMTRQPLFYEILDIRNQTLQHGLAQKSIDMIKLHLEAHNQVLVFINRRGFAPVLLCHQCGWMADCKACDSHLTMHKSIGRLICHHCGLTHAIPNSCAQCRGKELLPIGVGTQRIHEYLSQVFPLAKILRIDRDVVRTKKALDAQLEQINTGESALIIGTQMLAKGHHFPRLTLVVVLDADNGFYNQDFRALEQLGQLLIQVSGRAGRAECQGQVVIQTHLPDHPLLNILIKQGYDAFSETILTMRKDSQLPPYHFLAVIRVQGRSESLLLNSLHALKARISNLAITVLGPAPAPLARKANLYRMQLLISAPSRKVRDIALMNVREWLYVDKAAKGLRWNIDVDPMDLS